MIELFKQMMPKDDNYSFEETVKVLERKRYPKNRKSPERDGVFVVDLETGVFYHSIRSVARAFNKPINTVRDNITGTHNKVKKFKDKFKIV